MTRKPLTDAQRIEIYTELQRRVQVGAYLEPQHDGSFPEDDGSAESTTLESLYNLEAWARKQSLQFSYNLSSKAWSLIPLRPAEAEMEVEKIAAANGGRYRLRFRGQIMTVDAQALRDLTDWGLLHMRELEAESLPSVFGHLQRQQEEGQVEE